MSNIEELEAEVEMAKKNAQVFNLQNQRLATLLDEKEAENERLRKALMWIAVEAWDLNAAEKHARTTLEDSDDIRRP